MKTNNLEVATKLAKITNRPLEDFYDVPTEKAEESFEEETDRDGEGDEDVETSEETLPNTSETIYTPEPVSLTVEQTTFMAKYGGYYSQYGKLLSHKIQMTREDYKSLTKKMNQTQLFAHPLIYIMFYAEGQSEVKFPDWTRKFPEEEVLTQKNA